MKSELAIKRELARVERCLRHAKNTGRIELAFELRWSLQALAWVLEQNAQAPSRCFTVPARRKKVR